MKKNTYDVMKSINGRRKKEVIENRNTLLKFFQRIRVGYGCRKIGWWSRCGKTQEENNPSWKWSWNLKN